MVDVSGRDFEHYQGTTRVLDVTIVDTTGALADLSSVTAIVWQMARSGWGAPVVTKTLGDGITVLDEPNGLFAISLLPDDTETLDTGRYYHECRISEDTARSKVFTGHVTILRDMI